jgi:4-amino-4-deoxy-L-arabinose transferase-like glycosyltransferase
MKRQVLFIILLIFLAGTFFRLYKLGTSLSGLLVDEASYGYNAYSIVETGADEHGVLYPLVFRAFGDYKLPVYAYLTAISVKFFGMNSFAVRLPSALSGSFLILIAAALIWKVTSKNVSATVFASLLTAFSPFTYILSRFGYESNVALLLWAGSMVSFVLAIDENKKKQQYMFFVLHAVLLALTWYAYVAYRLTTFLFVLIMYSYLFLKQKQWKLLLVSGVTLFLLFLPLAKQALSGSGIARFHQVGLFSDTGVTRKIIENLDSCSRHLPMKLCSVLYNKGTMYSYIVVSRAVLSLSPSFLFLFGSEDLPYLSISMRGYFSLVLLPFFYLGIFQFFLIQTDRQDSTKKYRSFILALFISSVFPMILAGEPNILRGSSLYVLCSLLLTGGFIFATTWLRSLPKRTFLLLSSLIALFFFLSTLELYLTYFTVHMPKYDGAYNVHVVKFFNEIYPKYTHTDIYIRPSFSDPITYLAFTQHIPPLEYQNTVQWANLEPSGFQHARSLRNVYVSNEPSDTLCTVFLTNLVDANPKFTYIMSVPSANGALNLLNLYSVGNPQQCPNNFR